MYLFVETNNEMALSMLVIAKMTLAGALLELIQNVMYARITNIIDGTTNILVKKFGDLSKVIIISTPELNPVGSVFQRTST